MSKKQLRVLSELVDESEVPFTQIILYLANEGLYEQYFDELQLRKKYPLEPSITEEDFNNIVNGNNKVKKSTNNSKKDNKKEEDKKE